MTEPLVKPLPPQREHLGLVGAEEPPELPLPEELPPEEPPELPPPEEPPELPLEEPLLTWVDGITSFVTAPSLLFVAVSLPTGFRSKS